MAKGREVLVPVGKVQACFSEAQGGKRGSPLDPWGGQAHTGSRGCELGQNSACLQKSTEANVPGQNEGEGCQHCEGSWRVSLATIMTLASPQRERISYTGFSVLVYNPSHDFVTFAPIILLLTEPAFSLPATTCSTGHGDVTRQGPLLPLPLAHGDPIIPRSHQVTHDSAKQPHRFCMPLMDKLGLSRANPLH